MLGSIKKNYKKIFRILSLLLISKKDMRVVSHDDLEKLLTSLGIKKGKLNCAVCGELIDVSSVQAVYKSKGKIKVVCNKKDCFKKITYEYGA